MSCFTLVYLLLAQIASDMISMVIICPLYLVGLVLVGGLSSLAPAASELNLFLGVIFLFVLLVGYVFFALVAAGAVYSSLIYALQPWVQESQPFGETFQRSLDMIVYRFWRNLLIWGG